MVMKSPYEELCEPLDQEIETVLVNFGEEQEVQYRTIALSPQYEIDVEIDSTSSSLGDIDETYKLFLFKKNLGQEKPMPQRLSEHKCTRAVLFSLIYSIPNFDSDVELSMNGYFKDGLPLDLALLQPSDFAEADIFGLTQQLAGMVPNQGNYTLREDDERFDNVTGTNLIVKISDFVENGAKIETLTADTEYQGDKLWVAQHHITGAVQHLSQQRIEEPYISFQVQREGIEYVYERSYTGLVEVKQRIADISIRYASLESFEGDSEVCSFDMREVAALEQDERSKGLYIPTAENMQIFYDCIQNFDRE